MPETVDLRASVFDEDKYGEIERLRAEAWYAPVPDGYVFFNQAEAVWVLKCEAFKFDFFQINPETSPFLSASIEHELLNKHSHAHDRLQKLVLKALRDQVVDGLQERIASSVDRLLADFPDAGDIDFCEAFADPFPALVLGPMFGIPYADTAGLDDWIRVGGRKVDALQSGVGIEDVEQAVRQMHGFLAELLADRRANPGEDIFSELIEAEIDGDRLSDAELVSLAAELASAGVDTTRSQLPLILEQVLLHPEQMALIVQDPGLARQAVDEGMRVAPLPWALPHRAVMDVTHNGLDIRKGDKAMVLIPAVNRDPTEWDRPDVFDITRPRQRNFSFGYGMHSCLGAHLARMEMTIALQEILRRFDHITLVDVPERDVVQKGGAPKRMILNVRKRRA